ncbi:uncharacterized protein [Leptinotarsa decemlineata]|uniref:uncharacterized protein n=1 Tax=Leptinotarsa decemlineata TaxID=7539 RepID=UPI003D30795C
MPIKNLDEVLQRPFKTFTEEEQQEIVSAGRFTDLTDLCQNDKGKCRTFALKWYQRVRWLTGNTVNRRLYCWSCVLFPSGTSKIWNSTGFDDLKNLSQSVKKHEDTKEHTYSTVKLKLFMKNKRAPVECREEYENNVKVKRNREYLERLVDVASALACHEIPFCEGGNDGFYKCLIKVLKKYDDIVRTQIEESSPFKGLTKTIQIDLLQSISHTVRQRIVSEVSAANFFALQLDEVTCCKESRQVAVSIRFIKEARPVERFLGFYDVGLDKKAKELTTILEEELDILNFREKMIALSIDGGVVKSTELYELQKSLKNLQGTHNKCQFLHCYAHEFSGILAQSLKSIHKCKLFFSTITQFSSFYKTLATWGSLRNIDVSWVDSVSLSMANLKNNFVSILLTLECVTTSDEFEKSDNLISQAVNLINHLKSFEFMVFVAVFHRLFTLIDAALEKLKKNTWDVFAHRWEIKSLTEELKQMKNSSVFSNILTEVSNVMGNNQELTVTDMLDVYVQIVDHILYEIEGRFLDIELAEFCSLVSLKNIPKTAGSRKGPDNNDVTTVKNTYPECFDVVKLKSDLDLLYCDPAIAGVGSAEVTGAGDMLKFMFESEINECLPMLYRLLELVTTIPSLTEPLEGRACVLKRIREYCQVERNEKPRSALALLSIEKDLLCEMEKTSQWYSQVIDHFSTLPSTSSIELIYKTNEVSTHGKVEHIAQPELEIKSEADIF